ncbi:unnamed protein product [Anthophora quadrimaculata]
MIFVKAVSQEVDVHFDRVVVKVHRGEHKNGGQHSRLIEIAKGMFEKVEEKIDDTGKRLNSIFQPLWAQTTTTTTTEEPTTEPLDINFRQLIDVPTRCPPNHNFIRGHCRRMLG